MIAIPTRRAFVMFAAAFALPMLALGQGDPDTAPPADAAPPADLPAAKDLIAHSINAMGGAEAFKELKSLSFDLRFQGGPGLNMEIAVNMGLPDKYTMAVGPTQMVSNGEHVWAAQAGTDKVKVMSTAEASSTIIPLLPHHFFYGFDAYYPTKETIERVEFDGNDCYKVLLTAADESDTATVFFDAKTGLYAGREIAMRSPTGTDMMLSLKVRDWETVNGVKVISESAMAGGLMPTDQIFRFENISANTVDEAVFAMPDAVREQIEAMEAADADAEEGNDEDDEDGDDDDDDDGDDDGADDDDDDDDDGLNG